MKKHRSLWTRGVWIVVPFLHVQGMTLFPFVLIRDRSLLKKPEFVRHERIHLCQQLELWVLPFYAMYLWQYGRSRASGQPHQQAYRNIVFEKEAYACEARTGYLRSRPKMGWRSWEK